MRLRHLPLVLVALAAGSCGRVGYDRLDEVADRGQGAAGSSGSGGDPEGGLPQDSGSGPGGTAAGGASSGGNASSGGVSSGTGGASSGGVSSGDASSGGASSGGVSSGDASRTDASSGGAASGTGGASSGGTTGDGGGSASGGSAGSGGLGGGSGGLGGGSVVGCADRQREGFLDTATYPDIAACDGGFALPGVIGLSGPACGRAAGDDGSVTDGTGCNAEDLCAVGFHLCAGFTEVAAKSPTGCEGSAPGASPVFYVTTQAGAGQAKCGTAGTDDLFGCGTLGGVPSTTCAPLDEWSGDLCKALVAPWSCATKGREAVVVVKPGSPAGGALCCRD